MRLRPCRGVALAAVALATFVTPCMAARSADEVRQAALVTYIHGMTAEIARSEVGVEGVPHLVELLYDPDFPRRDNVVAMLAFLGTDETTSRLLDFLERPPAPLSIPEEDRALLLVGDALGRIASRGHPGALEALLDMVAPAGRGGIVGRAAERGAYADSMRNDLIESAVRGLSLTDSEIAANRLHEIAYRWTVPVVEGLDLAHTARSALRRIESSPSPMAGRDRTESGSVSPVAATRRYDGTFAGDEGDPVVEPDDLDPAPTAHHIEITSAQHAIAYGGWMDDARAAALLAVASGLAATDDYPSPWDVSCCVALIPSGPVQTYGTVDDGLDVITGEEVLVTVLDDPVARIKVVRHISWCGGNAPNILGCAYQPGHGVVVVQMADLVEEAKLWIHEYGHNTGLPHHHNPAYIMNLFLTDGSDALDQTECAAFHNPPPETMTTPIDVGVCEDHDADGVAPPVDNCPQTSNLDQSDVDLDQWGDVCDNCPDNSNNDQADDDTDTVGDICDNCPTDANASQSDVDQDGFGDACDICPDDADNDIDADTVCGDVDNCVTTPNEDQTDSDGDLAGDACDTCPFDADDDQDNDTVCGDVDNCPGTANVDQTDTDDDGLGDACDICPLGLADFDGDSMVCPDDLCPYDAENDIDADGFCGDVDTCPDMYNPAQVGLPIAAGSLYELSPDGTTIVYRSDSAVENTYDLYSVPIAGGTATRLNDPLIPEENQDVSSSFSISPDSSTVVYTADHNTENILELYSVPIGGGTPVKLNPPVFGSISRYKLSADSSTVVYLAAQDSADTLELYSVPIGGGVVTKVSGPMVTDGGANGNFAISPDSTRVVYVADQDTEGHDEIYSAPIGGGAVVKLNAPLADDPNSSQPFVISPDSSTVVYLAEQEDPSDDELYSVPILGGTPVKLNDPILPTGGEVSRDYAVTPDSSRVVFRADTVNRLSRELYSVPIGGGTPVRLHNPLPDSRTVYNFLVSPDGSTVVLHADLDLDNVGELFSVPVTGGTVTKLNPPFGDQNDIWDYEVRPDGAAVMYWADQEVDSVRELYTVPIGGGIVTKLSHGGAIWLSAPPQFTADSAWALYVAEEETDQQSELYAVPAGGGPFVKMSGPPVEGGDVISFQINATSSHTAYRADQRIDEYDELFSTPILPDADGDGLIYTCDNCPDVSNPEQADDNLDGVGNACEWGTTAAGGDVLIAMDDPSRGGASLVATLVETSTGAKDVYVHDASSGALVSSGRVFGPHYRTRGMVSVPDFSGNGSPEIAVAGVNANTGRVAVRFLDSATGVEVNEVAYSSNYAPEAIVAVPSFGDSPADEIALLGVHVTTGAILVRIKDSASGTTLSAVPFPSSHTPLDIAAVPSFGDTPADEIALLGTRPESGGVVVRMKDAQSGTQFDNVYFPQSYRPKELIVLRDVDGAGAPDLGVLGIDASIPKVQVRIKDAATRVRINDLVFSSAYVPGTAIAVDDVGGTGADEVGVIGVDAVGNVMVRIKDAGSSEKLQDLRFSSNYAPVAVAEIPNVGGGDVGVAVLGRHVTNGRYLVRIKSASTGATVAAIRIP